MIVRHRRRRFSGVKLSPEAEAELDAYGRKLFLGAIGAIVVIVLVAVLSMVPV